MAKKVSDPYFPDEEDVNGYEKPRYHVGMRSDTDPCCYKDFFETEKLSEAKEKAQEACDKYGKACVVWDRVDFPTKVVVFEPSKESMVAGDKKSKK